MKNLFLRSVMVVAIGMSTAAHAADMPVKAPITPPPIEGWTFSLTPYGWVLSLNGSKRLKAALPMWTRAFSTFFGTPSFRRT